MKMWAIKDPRNTLMKWSVCPLEEQCWVAVVNPDGDMSDEEFISELEDFKESGWYCVPVIVREITDEQD